MMHKIICQAGHESYTSHPQQKTCSHGHCAKPIQSIDGKIIPSTRGGYRTQNTAHAMDIKKTRILRSIQNQEKDIEYYFKQIREARERIATMNKRLEELTNNGR